MGQTKPYSIGTLILKFLAENGPMEWDRLVSNVIRKHEELAKSPPQGGHRFYSAEVIKTRFYAYFNPMAYQQLIEYKNGVCSITESGRYRLENQVVHRLLRPRFRVSDEEEQALKYVVENNQSERDRRRARILLRAAMSTITDSAREHGLSAGTVSKIVTQYKAKGLVYVGYIKPPKLNNDYLFAYIKRVDETLKSAVSMMNSLKEAIKKHKAR
jgi:DNA-binding Lrp family transcriptional regulator